MANILIYKRNHLIGASGGAEKVVCNFANEFAQRGYAVTVLTADFKKGMPFYHLEEKVNFINIGNTKYRGIKRILSKCRFLDQRLYTSNLLRETIDQIKPDIIISVGISELEDITYKQSYNIPIIQMFHSIPSFYFKKGMERKREVLQKAHLCQVLLPSFKENLQEYYSGNVEVIGNAVKEQAQAIDESVYKSEYNIVYMARIEPAKQQDSLVRAFASLAKQYPNWRLNLWGGGKDGYVDMVKQLIKESKLEDKVFLKGLTKTPIEELLKSDICAFPSSFEGFPLALTEAMSVGLPCLGLSSASGVNELIENEFNGLLAESEKDFAEKLARLIESRDLRYTLGKNAINSVKAYRPKVIWDKWEDLIKRIMG